MEEDDDGDDDNSNDDLVEDDGGECYEYQAGRNDDDKNENDH